MRKDNKIKSIKLPYSVWAEEQDLLNFINQDNVLIMEFSLMRDDPENSGWGIYREIWKWKDNTKDWNVSFNSYKKEWVDKLKADWT